MLWGDLMKYPKLVRNAKTPVHVEIVDEERNEFGEENVILSGDFKCNYQGKATTKFTSDKETVIVTGTVYIDGDIAPSIAEISGGKVAIFNEEREIYTGSKGRNPDGTVNFTRIDLK